MRIANYHTHIYLCKHATGTSEDYIKKAIDEGFEHIGISDHGPLSDELIEILQSRRMSEAEFLNVYLPDLNELKKKYADKITVLRALEIEYYDHYLTRITTLREKLDYLVLGQHEIYKDGKYKSTYSRSFDESDMEIYKNTVVSAMESGLFKIFAHPELYMYRYPVFNEYCEKVAISIAESALKNKVALEFNSNGIRSVYLKNNGVLDPKLYKYPYVEFWKVISRFQKENPELIIVLNDDSHTTDYFNDQFTQVAYELAKSLDLKITDKLEF